MNRFLNRRDKDGSLNRKEKSREKKARPLSGDSLWWFFKTSSHKKLDQEHANIVAEIKQKLLDAGHPSPEDDQVNFALGSDYADGDPERAYEILVLFQESVEGLIRPCDPNVKLVGAINRNNVTCYIDSVLFAMLGVRQSYDLIFCGTFENDAQRILSRMLLLYANMLRAGKLIHVDLTKNLQDALAACGWQNSPTDQQDASEFYGFIAQTLNIPLLSMKSNIFHHATPDESHDHRIVEEQVLNVSIPDVEEGQTVPLERCLEGFLNNKVEIIRSLPQTDLFSSIRSDTEKEFLQRWETSRSTPSILMSGRSLEPMTFSSLVRSRTLEERRTESASSQNYKKLATPHSYRKSHSRKDVRILAWQFFNILRPSPIYLSNSFNNSCSSVPIRIGDIAWHRKNTGSSTMIEGVDTEKSAPALVICLKRYGFRDGQPFRKNTPIDIPEEMLLPHLIDENIENYEQTQNFKLVLVAVVCHRGKSLNEGHYISLVRRAASVADGDSNSARKLSDASQPPNYSQDQWFKFDDLAKPRVTSVNFEEAILSEMPYLLFYQIQPQYQINYDYVASECTNSDQEPPSYDSGVALKGTVTIPNEDNDFNNTNIFNGTSSCTPVGEIKDHEELPASKINFKFPDCYMDDCTRNQGITSLNEGFSYSGLGSHGEESGKTRLSRAASKFTKSGLRSRASSQSGESRISAKISRLHLKKSKEQLRKSEVSKDQQRMDEPVEPHSPTIFEESNISPRDDCSDQSKPKKKKSRPKSQGKYGKIMQESQLVYYFEEKSRLKDSDRECKLM